MKSEQKDEFKKYLGLLFKYLKKELGIKRTPKLLLINDQENADKILGSTGSYDKQNEVIRLYITDRWPKDLLRSFSHEIFHHFQNENGELNSPNDNKEPDPKYAQNDPVLKKAEEDAYLNGNILFRNFEDNIKYGK